jgi:type I restriction enzyme R subunit
VHRYSEDTLVQQTTAEYLERQLGWESVYAYNSETFGPMGTLARASNLELVLSRYLRLSHRRCKLRSLILSSVC